MTQEFNLRPPVISPLVDKDGMLNEAWAGFYRQLFNFFQNSFNTSTLVTLPNLTTAQLSALPTSQLGSLTYNVETDEFMALKAAGFKVITTS